VRPLIGAIAAGNAVIIKPSEVSTNVTDVIVNLFPKYFDQQFIRVITGGPEETTELLKLQFDHILYTGNGIVGKIVMKAAAEHLTPVTLELGGKSPIIIDSSVDLKVAVPRICWGKFANTGQTCVAPDYALVLKDQYEPFLAEMKKCIKKFYGDNPKESDDFGKIISPRHAKRVADLIKGVDIYCGGETDIDNCYIAPTLVQNVVLDSKLMTEEIFGPVLPVIPMNNVADCINFVNQRPKPLALYVFSNNKQVVDDILGRTSSGGGGINEVIMQATCPHLPFGGVGPSGIGKYYGKTTFDIFSNGKAFLSKSLGSDPGLRFPPFTSSKVKWLFRLNSISIPNINKLFILIPVLIAVIAYFSQHYSISVSPK